MGSSSKVSASMGGFTDDNLIGSFSEGVECALHMLRMMERGSMHNHVGKVGVSIATVWEATE